MAIDFSDVAKPIDEKQLPNQVQVGLVDFSDVAKPIGTNESRNAYQWSPANGTIFDQIDQQKLMYDPNLPDATIGRVFMAGVKDAFEGYAGGSAMEAAESRNIMGMTPEQIKAHLGEGTRNSLMGDYALTKMENIDNNYIKNKEGIKAGIRDSIVDKATALAKMADPGDYNLPTSFLGQLGHDILRSTPYSMMSAVPSIATGALTGGAALPTLIVSFLTSMGEASSEGGRTYMSMIEAGKSHDEAYAAASKNKDFNTLMLTLSNMISGQLFGSVPRGIDEVNLAKLKGTPLSELSRAGQVMGKAMERPIISNIAKSPIKRGLVSLGSEFVMEGSEEMGQSISDAVVRGEKINVPNLLYEGLVGGLSGAGQSSVGTAIDYAKNRGARAKYEKLAELMKIMKEKDTPEGGNNKVVAEAISKFKGNEHNVMFDSLNERNRILALPLEDRSALEEQALPVLSEAVNLFAQGKVEEGLSLLAEKDINFDFEEEQTFPAEPQDPVKDVSMHSNETISAIGEGPQLQEVARAEFDRLRSIPEDQRTGKDNQQLEMYRNIMEAYTAGNNVAGDLGTVAQRTVAGQPINLGSQQVRPIIPGRSFNNAQLAMVEQGTPMDRTYVGEPKPVNGGFVVNKPDGNAAFVPSAEIGGYYRVDRGTEQGQTSPPTAPQIPQTQQVQRGKKQKQPTTAPQVRDGVGVGDIYLQNQDGAKYTVKGFDVNNKVVLTDELNKPVRATPEQLAQNFERLSPERKPEVQPTTPIRTAVQPAPVQTTTNVGTQAQMPTLTQQIPQVVNGVGVGDIYLDSQGTAFEVKNVTDDRVTIADFKGQSITVKHDTLSSEKYTRLSPIHKHGVPLSAPIRTDAPGLIQTQQATQKQATQPTMPRTPEVAKAAAKARTEKQAKPTTEKTNTSTPAQTTTEQEQMARGKTAQTPSESTTTNEVKKEDKVPKGTKETRESTVKVGEKYKNKTGQTVIVKSVEDGNVSFDLETPGIMKPSPRSIEKFTENYKKIDDDTKYKVEPETEERTKRTVTAKDISSAVKGAKVRETKDGIISIQFKNGFVLNVDPNSDEIVINPEIVKRDYGRDPNSGDKIIGSATMVGNEGFIRLISGMADLKTFNHELYHIAEKMVLTKEQIAIVERAYGGSEERANAFADVAFKRKQAKNKLVTSLFQKIADFFADIRASIFGERAEDIFRSVSEGKVWEQKLKDATKNVTGVTKDGRKMWVVGIPYTDKYMVVYHGTHAQGIEAFSLDYVDTGEGAQMFGWGLYFTDRKGIGKKYKQDVSEQHNRRLEAKTSGYMFDVLLGGEVFVPNNRWLELTSDIINQIVDNTKWRTKGLNAVTAEALNDVEEEIKRRINNAKDHIKWTEVALETRESLLEENLRQGHLSSGEETENASIKTLKSDVDYAREKKQVAEKSLEGYERAYEWFKQNKNSITFRSRGTEGSLYTVEIPDDEGQYLYWDKPLNAQSDIVKAFLEENEDYIDAMPDFPDSEMDEIISTVTNRWNAVMEQLTGTDAYKIFIDKLGYDEGDFDYSESDGGYIYPRWDTASVLDDTVSGASQRLVDDINKTANALREQFPAESGQLETIAIYASRLVNNRQSSISRWGRIKGEDFYEALAIELGSDKEASLALNEAGIIGIKYLNGMSRSKGEGGYNYVMFDDKSIQIIDESYKLVKKDKVKTEPKNTATTTMTSEALEALKKAVSLPSVLQTARSRKWATNAEFMMYIESYIKEKVAEAGLNYSAAWDEKADPEDRQKLKDYLVDVVHQDGLHALKDNENAIGWYNKIMDKAMNILSAIHPELATDPDARFTFTAALAVTSNGQKVDVNFGLANKAYEYYKKNGQFPTNIGIGTTAKTIDNGLATLNSLIDKFGLDTTNKLLTSHFTVGQLKKIGLEIKGELVEEWVIGAAVLGPKVGNGFFANLNGIFDALTMDRWFMRTWGRLTGKLFKTSLENIHNSEIRLQTALDAFIKSSEANGTDINDFIKSAFGPRSAKNISLTGNNVDLKALAKAIKNASIKEERRSAFNQTPEGQELRLAGNNLAGNMNAEKLDPAGGSERKFIREIFNEVLSNLHEEGYNTLTMADFQAILWYGEKRLYDSAKVADDIEGYEDSEAPDYANAAEKLARKLGVSEEVIQGAKERDTNVYDKSGTKSTGQDIQGSVKGVGVGDGGTERGTQANVTGFPRNERAGFLKRHIFLVERLKAVRKQEAKESGGGRNANVWVHKRKGTGGTGSVRLVEAVYTPTPALQTVLDKSEISAPTIYELTHTTENAQRFWDAIKAAKGSDSKHGAAVWLYEQSEYEGMRLFLSEDNKHGFAIKPDGDIVSAFKFKDKTDKKTDPDMRDKANWSGTANWMLTIATSEGGTKLDCFDTILPSIYRVNGFKEVRREAWDESQRVPDWNKENFAEYNNGEPDIVYMEYDPNYNPYDVNVAQTPNEGYRIAGEESDSTFKAPPVTLRAIKRAVPGAKVSITKDGLVQIKFKNGFVVNVNLSAKSIKIDQDVMKRDYGREATAGDIAVGRNYVTVDGEAFIDIVSGMTDMRTFHHELYEVARRMALSGQQLDILDKAFKGNKEAEAEAYADFMVKRLANQSKLVNSLFQKISDFFSDIRAKLFGQNSEDIFRQIGDGKVAMGSNTMNNEAYRIADKIKALDKQYMDAVENGDMETAQRLVNEAAELAGLPILDDSATVAYKVRRGPAPSKTEKAYKLFSTKKSRGGELFPLFVGANDAIPQGVWLDAMEGPSAGESKTGKPQVKSKLGNLSFRPGWHTSDMPIASHIGVKDANGDIVARRANEVWAEVEVSADVDYQTEAGDKDIKHMPTDGMYRYKTNPNMPGKWIISGSMKVNRVLTENEVNQILEDNAIDPMAWENGELLLERLGFSPEAVSNTGKLADPVTYDDNGRVIPLSERFNPDISDPRYRIVGMGGQKFSSPAEVTMVTPADKQVAKQKVANLQYVPAPQTTWKTDSGRNKKDQAAWHALTDGLESVVEKREPRMTLKERIVHVKDWIVDNWIDNLSIIQRTADEKLYRHARGKVDGISSRAEKLIKFGDKKRGVEGLTQIFKGMSDEEFKGFLHYAEYKNIIDIINNSEEAMRFISKAYDEIASEKARLKELRSTKPLDADDAKQLARGIRGTVRYIEQLQKDIDHSLEYVREVRGKADQYLTTVMKMEKLYPDWVERQQKLTKYTNNLLRINRDSGMISANLYRFLTETRPNYLPALRDFSDEEGKVGLDSFIETRGFVNLKSPLRRMHGSKRDIVNPIDEIIANTFRTMSLEAKQSVATSFIDFYESRKDGDEYLWRTKPDKAIEEGHFMFFVRRDGEKHYYATDSPALYEALTLRSTSKINLGSVGKPAELITKILRQATTRAVRFIVRNPERDNFQAAIYGEGFIPFVTAFRGGIQVVGGGEWFERFLEAGGAQGISTVDSDRLADMKAEILGKKFFRSKNPLKNIWNLLGRVAEVTELSTRVGQFKKAIELGYTDEEAAYIARDLMNFGIGGSDAKQMNRYIPFLTASIQDMNRFYRGHSKKNIAKTVRRAMMYITIPTLALWFWNNGDDDRKEYWDKLATWEKNAFWWIILNKDTAIPVAKPFLLGLVYGSLPERFMDYWLNNDRRAVEDFGKTLLAQTMPGYMPLALQLVMEWVLNKSFFYGREIVPANEQKLEGKLQYGPYTSEWAKAMGNITGISPRKLEYTVFGVTGSLGKEISAVVDDVWRSVSGTTRPDKYITEYIPGSTAWISHGRNHMGPLYAWNLAFPALEEAYRSAKKVYEVDGADSLSDRQRLLLTYENDVKAILKLNTHKEGIWKLQSLKNKVVVDKAMTAEQKRKAVDEINARIILLSQVGLKKLDFFQDAIDSMEDKMKARR